MISELPAIRLDSLSIVPIYPAPNRTPASSWTSDYCATRFWESMRRELLRLCSHGFETCLSRTMSRERWSLFLYWADGAMRWGFDAPTPSSLVPLLYVRFRFDLPFHTMWECLIKKIPFWPGFLRRSSCELGDVWRQDVDEDLTRFIDMRSRRR